MRPGLLAEVVGCALLAMGCVAHTPWQARPSPLTSTATVLAVDDDARIVGVTTAGGERLTFDTAPALRVSGDTLYANVAGAPYLIPRASIGQMWVARPGERPAALGSSAMRVLLARKLASLPTLTPGLRVGVDTSPDSGFFEGHLVRLQGDSVVLVDGEGERAFALGSDRHLWVPAGTRSYVREFTPVGMAIGMVAGAAAYKGPTSREGFGEIGAIWERAAWGLGGGLIGAGLGALVGSAIHTTIWAPVPLNRLAGLRIGVAPLRNGRPGLRLALSF